MPPTHLQQLWNRRNTPGIASFRDGEWGWIAACAAAILVAVWAALTCREAAPPEGTGAELS